MANFKNINPSEICIKVVGGDIICNVYQTFDNTIFYKPEKMFLGNFYFSSLT